MSTPVEDHDEAQKAFDERQKEVQKQLIAEDVALHEETDEDAPVEIYAEDLVDSDVEDEPAKPKKAAAKAKKKK